MEINKLQAAVAINNSLGSCRCYKLFMIGSQTSKSTIVGVCQTNEQTNETGLPLMKQFENNVITQLNYDSYLMGFLSTEFRHADAAASKKMQDGWAL